MGAGHYEVLKSKPAEIVYHVPFPFLCFVK